MKKLFIIITLVILISIIACTPRMIININDQKIPDHYFVLKTVESEITIKIIAKEFLITQEKGEKVIGVKELRFNDINKIKYSSLAECEIQCIIENPKNAKYEILEKFIIQSIDDDFPTFVKKIIYRGKLSTKTFTIKVPKIKKGVVIARLYIKDNNLDYPIFIPEINIKYY